MGMVSRDTEGCDFPPGAILPWPLALHTAKVPGLHMTLLLWSSRSVGGETRVSEDTEGVG